VASDHGENLGDNGLIAHGLSLDNRLLHVPFIVAGPDAGAREINSLADLPRYIAERVGLEGHPWDDGPPPGFGVAQFDPPATDAGSDVIRRFQDIGWGDALDRFTTPLTCAVAGDLKLLRRGDHEELYDLTADPLELDPIPPDEASSGRTADLAALREALNHPSVTSIGEASEPVTPTASEEETRDLEERMRLLGYM
jgi:hypothetical protein